MLGVIAHPLDQGVVAEFFELFKTPWEFYRAGRTYDVLLCRSDAEFDRRAAKLAVIYRGRMQSPEAAPADSGTPAQLSYNGQCLPVYGDCATFGAENRHAKPEILVEQNSGKAALQWDTDGPSPIVRIGYDLFAEVRTLLTEGQPAVWAGVPTLELHIALLRDLISRAGISLAEIPPVPAGYRFIACLTHDVDHPLVGNHGFDHTTLGFLYRATVGSLGGLVRGRRRLRDVARNWAAVARLPLVHLGVARDFWNTFERYLRLEGGTPSSFFVIPFRDRPGRRGTEQAPAHRAARYGAKDIAGQIRTLVAAGCEVGTHGIDAWTDAAAGRTEMAEIRRVAGATSAGIRMHWLYFSERSPAILEEAGADYDSTMGYNQTVGFRSGTTQVYRPPACTRLLELPLHIMDTALFYPDYLNLTPREAMERVVAIIDHAVAFGGCVTINWHDRSIAPERCWEDFYVDLLEELRKRGAWFGTAADTVAWFRQRRSAEFERADGAAESVGIRTAAETHSGLPALDLRIVPGSRNPALIAHA